MSLEQVIQENTAAVLALTALYRALHTAGSSVATPPTPPAADDAKPAAKPPVEKPKKNEPPVVDALKYEDVARAVQNFVKAKSPAGRDLALEILSKLTKADGTPLAVYKDGKWTGGSQGARPEDFARIIRAFAL